MSTPEVAEAERVAIWDQEKTRRFWDELIYDIEAERIIPIIGPELLHVGSTSGEPTIYAWLADRLSRHYGVLVSKWSLYNELKQVISEIVKDKRYGRDELENIYRLLWHWFRSQQWNPPEPLLQLAAITPLSLFVTTTFDSCMADALDKVRYGGQRKTTRTGLFLNAASDLREAGRQKDVIRPESDWQRPTRDAIVFNLFGAASEEETYAIHDEDILEYVHAFTSDEDLLPAWLTKELKLKQKRILMIGCHFSDWLARFVIRRTAAQRLLATRRGKICIVAEDATNDRDLISFLELYSPGAQIYPGNARDFVAELTRRWKEHCPVAPTPQPSSSRGASALREGKSKISVFVSYVREDLAAAEKLANSIEQLGGNVWLDKRRITPGADWLKEILEAIDKDIDLFVAIISNHTEIQDESEAFREWKAAINRSERFVTGRKFVIPVVVDSIFTDVDKYANARKLLGTAIDYGWAPAGNPDDRLNRTLTDQIRGLRTGQR